MSSPEYPSDFTILKTDSFGVSWDPPEQKSEKRFSKNEALPHIYYRYIKNLPAFPTAYSDINAARANENIVKIVNSGRNSHIIMF
jgi:hypothetical protein